MLANRVRLMVNPDEPLYVELLKDIEQIVGLLVMGMKNFDQFHELNDEVKRLAQRAIRREWKKIVP